MIARPSPTQRFTASGGLFREGLEGGENEEEKYGRLVGMPKAASGASSEDEQKVVGYCAVVGGMLLSLYSSLPFQPSLTLHYFGTLLPKAIVLMAIIINIALIRRDRNGGKKVFEEHAFLHRFDKPLECDDEQGLGTGMEGAKDGRSEAHLSHRRRHHIVTVTVRGRYINRHRRITKHLLQLSHISQVVPMATRSPQRRGGEQNRG